MKHLLLTVIITFTFAQIIFCQIQVKPQTEKDLMFSPADTSKVIENIEKEVQEIDNNRKKHKKTEKTNDPRNDKYIYKDSNEVKLIAIYTSNNGSIKTVEWYFAKEELIYCRQLRTSLDSITKAMGTEKFYIDEKFYLNEKFYLYNQHLIRWTKDGKTIDTNSEEFKNVDNDLPAFAKELIKQSK